MTCFKKLWFVENQFKIVTKLNERNTKNKAKSISAFDFTTLYATILHNLLIRVLSEVIKFVFKNLKLHWLFKTTNLLDIRRLWKKKNLIDAISFPIIKYYFNFGNQVFKQEIGISMDADPAPYWVILSIYFETKYVQQLISKGSLRAFKFHGISKFILQLLHKK